MIANASSEAGDLTKMEEHIMDATTIRIIAGVLAVVVLFIIIWRRKKKALD
jgi:predicted RND superfamily exporter protein